MAKAPLLSRAGGRAKERPSTDDPSPIVRTEPVLSSPLSTGVLILTVLALIGALYFGKEVILPIALAIVLKLLLQPVLNFLCNRLRFPTALAALILICGLFAGIAAVAF